MDLSEACISFLAYCKIEKNLSPHTLSAYRGDLEQFEKQLTQNKQLMNFSEAWIEESVRIWCSDPALKAATVKRRLACIKVFVRWLFQRKFIRSNFLDRLQLSIRLPKRLPRNLQTSELRQLVAISPETLTATVGMNGKLASSRQDWDRLTARLAIEILTLTGIRVGELSKVRNQDIDYELRQIHIFGKGNRERKAIFPDSVTSGRIRSYRQSAVTRFGSDVPETLLLNGLGRPVNEQYLRRVIRIFAENADLSRRVTPHMLRHTAATQLLEAGVDIRFVQKILGHASITTTEIYTHVADSALREKISRVNIRRRLEMHR